MKNHTQGSLSVILAVIIGLVVVGGGAYYVGTQRVNDNSKEYSLSNESFGIKETKKESQPAAKPTGTKNQQAATLSESDLGGIASPKTGEVWKLAESKTIVLNTPIKSSQTDINKFLVLIDKNGAQYGIIDCGKNPELKANFRWDVKTVVNFCGAAISGKNKTVVAGTYKIAVREDGPGQRVLMDSGYFSIVE
ncbi:MAG TPA: hypothetical protein VEB60_01735 [Candidatus Paceibacterota bacterium]|nr:hypothetical protein [Candidatus Paceibacterota bacterium]